MSEDIGAETDKDQRVNVFGGTDIWTVHPRWKHEEPSEVSASTVLSSDPEKLGPRWLPLSQYDQMPSLIASLMYSLIQKVEDISRRLGSIEDCLSSLESRISLLEEDHVFEVSAISVDESAVKLSREEAKGMIMELFDQKGELDYIEIMSTLDLDLELIVELCAELEKEGKIKGLD
jgi:hypothetical protein